ncbi:MAG: YfiR family protein [Betaproteobacteria bacterium]|nr:YfiR family protein [Betaproteobacteria bacterium]
MNSAGLRLAFLLLPLGLAAGSAVASDQALKLAFVYNFAKFTDWPERSAPRGALELCVAADDVEHGAAMRALAGRSVRGAPLRVRSIEQAAEVTGCHVVYVPDQNARQVAEIAQAARNAGVLSVSDHESFLRLGGMIGLVSIQGRLQFEVDQETALRAGLHLNAQLLQLARSVRRPKT